ncbi:MAG: NAD(P)H-dependent glycerol-3-phosphate dehydrogenase [Vampirovibrionales bacterium]|nr:NAD(P)H-dependent glycerol-3-phosphate dehydrogenase [Vampirovibrionales bacterium]
MKKLAILGAGSWGLTLAWLACLRDPAETGAPAPSECQIVLWDRTAAKIEAIKKNRAITFPVNVTLSNTLELTASLAEAVQDADVVLLAVTSNGTREVARQLKASGALSKNCILVNCSKGIEFSTLKRISQVLDEEVPENRNAVLSGPALAKEILAGLPTACAVAAKDAETAEYLQHHLGHERLLRLYSNTDVTGVELGGSLKNVFAIPSGYMQAKKLGDNAQASLITRGLAEMTRFSVALGAKPETLYGLSGLGDLLATCNSPLSRNYQVGARLAQGETLENILSDLKVVAEGVKTTYAVLELAKQLGIDMPIVEVVKRSLSEKISEKDIIKSLMSRKLKPEQVKE